MKQLFVLSLLFGFLTAPWLPAQKSFGIGTGISYDYGLKFSPDGPYRPFGKGEMGAVSFDGYLRIPLGPLSLTPAYFFTIPTRSMRIDNTEGEYIPEGYGIVLPYHPNNPSYYSTPDYADLSARAEIWQQTYGAFVTLNLGEYVGLGSGLFMRNRNTFVYQDYLYDTYLWSGSDGTYDYYDYWDTDYAGYEEHIRTTRDLTWPILLNMEGRWGNFSSGTSFIYWIGGGDNYVSFRYSMGLSF
jgi:hypothetical protein